MWYVFFRSASTSFLLPRAHWYKRIGYTRYSNPSRASIAIHQKRPKRKYSNLVSDACLTQKRRRDDERHTKATVHTVCVEVWRRPWSEWVSEQKRERSVCMFDGKRHAVTAMSLIRYHSKSSKSFRFMFGFCIHRVMPNFAGSPFIHFISQILIF